LKAPKAEADERLLVEAAQKDPRRFAELYDVHFERIYAFIASRVHQRDAAEDLTSEVFQQALANLPSYEWRGVPFAAWLFRIASNAIADCWKSDAREQGDPSPEAFAEPDAAETDDIERRAHVFRCVAQLPEVQRRVIELRFAEEKSIREIAREIKKSEGAVKQLQFRALQNLRTLMSDADA
jgi:RNA polymerase sigma-70 factor (ECF subfamily)